MPMISRRGWDARRLEKQIKVRKKGFAGYILGTLDLELHESGAKAYQKIRYMKRNE